MFKKAFSLINPQGNWISKLLLSSQDGVTGIGFILLLDTTTKTNKQTKKKTEKYMKQWLSGHWKSVNSDFWHKSSNWGEPCSCPDYCLEKVPRPQHRGEDPKQSCTFSLSLVDGIAKLGNQRCLEFIRQNTGGKSTHYTERKFQSCAEGHPQPFSWVLLSKTCEEKNWGQEKDHGEDIGGQTSEIT